MISKLTDIVLILTGFFALNGASPNPVVTIHYLGHSSFVMRFDNGVTVVTDYGHENIWKKWGWDSPIYDFGTLIPDVMTFSHQHDDHYDPERIPAGVKHIIRETDSLDFKGIRIRPFPTCEKTVGETDNTSFLFSYKGLRILHLGDAQAEIMAVGTDSVKNHIAALLPDSVDLLLMTIEGTQKFIPQAELFVDLLSPKRIIPMHYWSEAYRQDFLDCLRDQKKFGRNYHIIEEDSPTYVLSSGEMKTSVQVISLKQGPFN